MAGGGWIALYRSLEDHWIWENPTYLKWWLDILFMVNHKENKFLFDGQLISVGIGERITSEVKLAERWGVSRNTVRKFLDLLVSDEMISLRKSRKSGTWLKVRNYADYQSPSGKTKQQTEHPVEQPTEQPTEHLTEHKQQVNNDNNDKQINNDVDDVKGVDIYQTYQEVFGVLNPLMSQNLEQWAEDLTPELVNEALVRSGMQGAKKFSYTEVILRNWEKEGVKTVEDVAALDAKREKNNRKSVPAKRPARESNSEVSF